MNDELLTQYRHVLWRMVGAESAEQLLAMRAILEMHGLAEEKARILPAIDLLRNDPAIFELFATQEGV